MLAVFSHAAEEIRFFKKQQWLVTSYALTAFFALALAPQYIGACEKVEIWSCVLVNFLCAIVVLVTAIAALIVLWSLDEAHQKELNRMNAARQRLLAIRNIHTAFPSGRAWQTVPVIRSILRGLGHMQEWPVVRPVVRHIRRGYRWVRRGLEAEPVGTRTRGAVLFHLDGARTGGTVSILRFALSIGAVLAIVINVLLRAWASPLLCTAG